MVRLLDTWCSQFRPTDDGLRSLEVKLVNDSERWKDDGLIRRVFTRDDAEATLLIALTSFSNSNMIEGLSNSLWESFWKKRLRFIYGGYEP